MLLLDAAERAGAAALPVPAPGCCGGAGLIEDDTGMGGSGRRARDTLRSSDIGVMRGGRVEEGVLGICACRRAACSNTSSSHVCH